MEQTTAAIEKTARTTAAVPRGWRSLLTGRWHRSSWVVAAVVLLLLVFCNLPGQLVTTIRLTDEFPPSSWFNVFLRIEEDIRFEHGWPLSYLVRPNDHSPAFDSPEMWNCWTLSMNQPQFHGYAVAVNALVALALAAGSGMLFEGWRRMRLRVWQFHLRDFLAVFLAISLAGAWYASRLHQYRREQAIFAPLHVPSDSGFVMELSPPTREARRTLGGTTWIRLLAGESALGFLDRASCVFIDRADLPQVRDLQDVRLAYIEGRATSEDLRHLEQLPRLRALQLDLHNDARAENVLKIPRLPQLRVLIVELSKPPCEGLAELASLEVLELSHCRLTDAMLQEIGRMPRLRSLHLKGVDLPAGGLGPLTSLSSLTDLTLEVRQVSTATIDEISHLTGLKRLSLRSARLPSDSVKRLAALDRLETLYLNDCDLRSTEALAASWWSDIFSGGAWKTRVGLEALTNLKQMQQLRVLSLGKTELPQEQIDSLKAALPRCEVKFTR